jgi:GMP synthase-like glutamine amidotransferase
MPRALVMANDGDDDPGAIGDAARHAGFELVVGHRERPGAWPELDHFELLILLGSDWSVHSPPDMAAVRVEQVLVRAAHTEGIPTLGICYGAQLVAAAHGAAVRPAEIPEVGWFGLDSDEPGLVETGPWFEWHFDVFSVPPGAREVARSEAGPQAFVLGRTLAVQFHPDVTPQIARRWTRYPSSPEQLAAVGLTVDDLLAAVHDHDARSRAAAQDLFTRFLEQVAGTSQHHSK